LILFPYSSAIDIDERVLDIRERRNGATKREEEQPLKREAKARQVTETVKTEGIKECKQEDQVIRDQVL